MPIPGSSLVGFLDQAVAVAYLENNCVWANLAPGALAQEWSAARQKLQGVQVPNAGHPNVKAMAPAHQQHLTALQQQPHYQMHARMNNWSPASISFEWVEIAPLLAFQFHVSVDDAANHKNGLSAVPTEQELLDLCLPVAPRQETPRVAPSPNSILMLSKSLNLRRFGVEMIMPGAMTPMGILHPGAISVIIGVGAPYVHVVRLNGTYILHNGYHRSYAAGKSGATHVPCIVRDVQNAEQAGFVPQGTLEPATVLGANPPTVGHFVMGYAYDVPLKKISRAINVTWTENVVPEE